LRIIRSVGTAQGRRFFAIERICELTLQGDEDGAIVWTMIADRIEKLQRPPSTIM
jgi:hypothetical protein